MKYSIAVVGNPNSGKTTVFNGLTGSTQRIGNWPGVTVEKKSGKLLGADNVEVVDIPGLYSLNVDSEDELIARNHILTGDTDLVVNIIDTSNLERNLFLTLALLEMGKPTLLVLNMIDLAYKKGLNPNIERLSRELGIPVIAVNALNNTDLRNMRRTIVGLLDDLKNISFAVPYPKIIENTLVEWSALFEKYPRQNAIMLLEEDEQSITSAINAGRLSAQELQSTLDSIQEQSGNTADAVIAEARYAYIHKFMDSIMDKKKVMEAATEKIDRIVLNKWLGFPVLMAVMFAMFWVVIHIGGAFIDFFGILSGAIFVEGFGIVLENFGIPEWIIALLSGGVGAGIQTVATFIPIVFFMFLTLSILEESGYMARAAFVMDRFMRMMGLPGQAFVPMLLGFGCTVPAVMSTRTLANKKDRYLTVFMAPFMSCGARLPVYILFGATFFGRHAGMIIFSIYAMGILLAVFTGLLLKRTLFHGEISHFVMELPSYHTLRLRQIMHRTWNRMHVFIMRAGKTILIGVLILSFLNSMGTDGSFGNENNQKSVLTVVGEVITPIFVPMGIEKTNWPASVSLLSGLFAKEAIIGTINGLYNQMNVNNAPAEKWNFGRTVLEALRSIPDAFAGILSAFTDSPDTGTQIFSALRSSFDNDWTRAYAYLLFVLIYFPCVAAMGAITQEIGFKFGFLSLVYLTVLAWSVATLFFQIATGHSLFFILLAVILVVIFIPIFNLLSGRWQIQK